MQDIESAKLLLQVSIGLTMVIFGISQYKSPSKWTPYMPAIIRFLLPIKSESFMKLHAAGNISLGALLTSGLLQPLSIWLALIWWIWILTYAFYYEFSIGIRDIAIICGLASLLLLV